MRILLVDDDPVFREELGEHLKQEGHFLATAPSVLKAEEALQAAEFDVVLTDLKMPRKGGMELLRLVRSQWPRTLVVVVTGYASVDTALEAMKLGAFDYVRKPFRVEQVRETLRLAAQELEFEAPEGTERDPEREARTLAASGTMQVLYLSDVPLAPTPHLTSVTMARLEPADVPSLVEDFLTKHAQAGVVIASLDRWLAIHRLEDVVAVLDRLRTTLEGHGPLRVGFTASLLPQSAASAVADAVAAIETHETLEALANPIRRKILQRLADGPATFRDAMRAAGLDDSPKISFHLRKLAESKLVRHEGDQYRLTPRGEACVRLLVTATFLPPASTTGNRAFARSGPKPD